MDVRVVKERTRDEVVGRIAVDSGPKRVPKVVARLVVADEDGERQKGGTIARLIRGENGIYLERARRVDGHSLDLDIDDDTAIRTETSD